MRTKRAVLNFVTDALPLIILSVIGIFKIKVLLTYLGSDMLGVYQLYGQLLAYVAIAEAGLTPATMYHLYKPIGEKNYQAINSILSASRYIFNIIAIVMLVAGVILSFNINFFIKDTNLPTSYLMITFILFIVSNIINYFQVSHRILFDAEQKRYVSNIIFQTVQIIKGIAEIIIVMMGFHLIAVLMSFIILSLIANFILAWYSKKQHKYINFKEEKDFSIWKDTKHVIPHKIGTLIAFNIDIILISKFLGLTQVVIYSSYNYITESIRKIVSRIGSSIVSGIGDMLVTNKEKAYNVFQEYNAFVFFVASIICAPLLFVINDFVRIWYGQEVLTTFIASLLFVVVLFYNIIRQPLNSFVEAAGLFKETEKLPILESIINLSLSLLLIKDYGIAGVLFGTIVSLIISEYLIKPMIVFKKVFNQKLSTYYCDNFKYLFIFIAVNLFNFMILSLILNPQNILVWFITSSFVFITNVLIVTLLYKMTNQLTFINRLMKVRK